MHKIDLKNYEVRSDMAIDFTKKNDKTDCTHYYEKEDIKVTWLKLNKNNKINKKEGTYITIEFTDVTDDDAKKKVSDVLKEELSTFLKQMNISKETKTLVIGLGNNKSTPDALGPLVIEKIIVTNHFFEMRVEVENKFSPVACFEPSVTGKTGIETTNLINGVVNEIKPDLVIVVDALCSSSISRVNKSIQITDTGISPGSGIGNKRKEISKETLGIPVIAIGIPTVLDAAVIVRDTINHMKENYSYNKDFLNKKSSKLVAAPINYINKNNKISKEDDQKLLGMIGMLNDEELLKLTYEVLTPIGYNLMVTPKEIDFVIENLSEVISYGINHSLHDL